MRRGVCPSKHPRSSLFENKSDRVQRRSEEVEDDGEERLQKSKHALKIL